MKSLLDTGRRGRKKNRGEGCICLDVLLSLRNLQSSALITFYIIEFKSGPSGLYIILGNVWMGYIFALLFSLSFVYCWLPKTALHTHSARDFQHNSTLLSAFLTYMLLLPLSNDIASCCSVVGASWDLGTYLAVYRSCEGYAGLYFSVGNLFSQLEMLCY